MSSRGADADEAGRGDDTGGPGWARLPWLAPALDQVRTLARSHAILAYGPAGVGQLEFALQAGQGLLCQAMSDRPCNACASCRQVRQFAHPDLRLLVPDAQRLALGWPPDEDTPTKADAKPSKEIRIAQVRRAIAWAQQTAARGGAKVLLIHPADALNIQAANALLKTLEEPPGSLRLLLTSVDPERLLPTVRSRCQRLRLELPDPASARAWLVAQGLSRPDELLRLAGGSPLQALAWAQEGLTPEAIAELPRRIAAGDGSPLSGKPVPRVIDLLLRLAHDLMAAAAGGAPRFFAAASLPGGADFGALVAWQRELLQIARHDDHPWQAPLLVEALAAGARELWTRRGASRAPPPAGASLHSTP